MNIFDRCWRLVLRPFSELRSTSSAPTFAPAALHGQADGSEAVKYPVDASVLKRDAMPGDSAEKRPAVMVYAPDGSSSDNQLEKAWLSEAISLKSTGRYEDAENYLQGLKLGSQVAQRFLPLLRLEAELAELRGAHATAAERWMLVQAAAETQEKPGAQEGFARAILCFSKATQHGQAELVGEEAIQKYPSDKGIIIARGYAAQRSQDWRTAAARWAKAMEMFPDVIDGYIHAAKANSSLGNHALASELLIAALSRFPGKEIIVLKSQAYAAEARSDWGDALHLWREAEALSPNDLEAEGAIKRNLYKYRIALADKAADALASAPNDRLGIDSQVAHAPEALLNQVASVDAPAALVSDSSEPSEILMHFESIGGNCEFGLVQRKLGAEPVGLFRWGGIAPERLIEGLNLGFPFLGCIDNTILQRTDYKLYFLRDDKSGFGGHTHVAVGTVDETKFLKQQCRRLSYLRNKLLEDLKEAQKTFVYKPDKGHISDDKILELHQSMLRYGPAVLLCVRLFDRDHEPGSVIKLSHGLYVGHIDSVWEVGKPIDYEIWLRMCRKILSLRKDRQ